MTDWLEHAGRVARLIELRSPWRHQTLYERHLLEINRLTICLSYLLKRKRCFLEQPDWVSVPWALDPSSKTPLLRLQDILCAMPGLVEDATNLKLPQIRSNRLKLMRESLSERIFKHLHSLYEWRALWETENPSSCYELAPINNFPKALGISIDPIFSNVIHFSNLTCAHEIALYNAILILLLRLGDDVIGPTFDHTVAAARIPRICTNGPLIFQEKHAICKK
jgi:hypothetical protein